MAREYLHTIEDGGYGQFPTVWTENLPGYPTHTEKYPRGTPEAAGSKSELGRIGGIGTYLDEGNRERY